MRKLSIWQTSWLSKHHCQETFGQNITNFRIYLSLLLLSLFGLDLPAQKIAVSGSNGRVLSQQSSVKIVIESKERFRNVPHRIEVDFAQLLREQKRDGRFDRFSVSVKKVVPKSGRLEDVAFYLSEAFLWGDKGDVHWLIGDTDEKEYVLFFDVKENGPFPPPKYMEPVGDGDCLRFNDGKLHPLHVGMHANAAAVDWDGDGMTDIISPQIYSSTMGSPWFSLRFFRNEGSNRKPVFGESIPLRVWKGGKASFIEAGYGLEITDWNHDGRSDVLTFPYTKKELSIYLNTGRRDEAGLPILEADRSIPLPSAGLFTGLRVVDWFGDGRKSLLLGHIKTYSARQEEPLWFPSTEEEKRGAKWPRMYYKSYIDLYENTAAPGETPRLQPPVRVADRLGKEITFYTVSSFEVMDWDNDGRLDLLVQKSSDLFEKGFVGVQFYKNVGTKNSPQFEDRGTVESFQDRNSLGLRKVDAPGFHGMFAHPGTAAGKIQFFSFEGRDGKGFPVYRDRGFLQQRNTYLNSYSGYAQGQFSDWDKDGDLDLLTGCETGFVLKSKNIGSVQRPMFQEMAFLQASGKPICLLNGPFGDPSSFLEANIGQTAPMYIDWDKDGIPDLIVVNGERLLLYKNVGSPAQPKLLSPVELTADGGQRLMKHRNKPALIDWNGDGLVDVIGHDADEKNLLLFLGYRDPGTKEICLATGVPMRYRDGTPVVPAKWHRYAKYFNAADWKNKGAFDIWLSASDQILYLENVGTNEKPLFLPPVRLAKDGVPIRIGHHVSTPFPVEWDGDNKMDLLVSGESGLFHLFRRNYLDGIEHRIECRLTSVPQGSP